jgi:hypothetical protein
MSAPEACESSRSTASSCLACPAYAIGPSRRMSSTIERTADFLAVVQPLPAA